MTGFDAKLTRFHALVRDKNLRLSLLDPIPYRLLRRLGVQIAPPVFQPMWLNLAVVFISMDIPLTGLVVAWPMFFETVALPYLLAFSFVSTIASGGLALLLALTWWRHKHLLDLPDWEHYEDDES